jgi:hypothetical protein
MMMASNIIHAAAVRLRVKGQGNLKLSLHSYDDVRNQILHSVVMQATTNIEPRKLSNFLEQAIQLKIETTEIDEWFDIHKIVVFVKPVYTDYPDGG